MVVPAHDGALRPGVSPMQAQQAINRNYAER